MPQPYLFDLDQTLVDLVHDFRANAYRRVFLFPGAVGLLTELRERGHPLAIVSNGSTATQARKIAATGLQDLVDAVIVSESIGLRKPDPRIFRAAADAVGALPIRCTFIGDDPVKDIAGAAETGMRTAWLAHGRAWPPDLEVTPTIRLERLSELLDDPTLTRAPSLE